MLAQATAMVTKMKASTSIDYLNGWKLVTFFIGGNDLCKSCKDEVYLYCLNYMFMKLFSKDKIQC